MANPLYDRLFQPNAANTSTFLSLPGKNDLTHADFAAMAHRIASALLADGIRPGDRVAAQVAKSPEALALYAACVQIGAVFLPLNTAYTGEELKFFLSDCEASVLLCDADQVARLADVASAAKARVMALDAATRWQGGGSAPPAIAERAADDIAALLYTSGTTGRPKGAMLTHDNLLSNAEALVDLWGIRREDVLLHALPIYHSHGLFVASNVTLLRGARMIFLPKFDADEAVNFMPDASMMMGVPTFYTRLLDHPGFDGDATAGMRLFISGSAPLLAPTHKAFEARTGHRILERYGLTETSMNTSNPLEGERRAGTVGMPLPGVTILIGNQETGQDCPEGEIGEVLVKGPNVFRGYWQLPEKTADSFTEDGFFKTGDLGFLDADGYLTIAGRSKDLIISGGLNVYPNEIEDVIDALDGVVESAVIGLPDADFGERVVAVVVPAAGVDLDTGAMTEALRKRLASFKIPKAWHLVDALPRNAMGKVQKNALRETYTSRQDATP